MKLDILAFGAHPDDVELGAAGTIAKHIKNGKTAGIVDLTQGELGTRGTPELRLLESAKAGEILGITARENLKLRDGFVTNNEESQLRIIEMLRKYKPEVVLCNAPKDRHPDHGNASALVREACFKSGLKNIKTQLSGKSQEAWRPKVIYMYIQYYNLTPDILLDISGFENQKIDAIKAYESQFYNPNSKEPETVISSPAFFDSLLARTQEWGRQIYVDHAEGFLIERPLGTDSFFNLK